MTENLFKSLKKYSESGIYPFCMPGHKRNFSPEPVLNPYDIDITEVEGFDDLQKCEGILGDIQKEIADIYGVKSAFMSVNGSTASNLAAVLAVPEGGRIAIASNCHPSVFNGAKINKRETVLVEPAEMDSGLKGGISLESAANVFEKYKDIKALIVTSPTYEGFLSDIEALADLAHRRGALLIADEAHGAHLPFCEKASFPRSALYQGTDIVVESLHKTLPALNQTSLVFVPSGGELAVRVKEKLNMVMTTSPSYILMASIQTAVQWAFKNPEKFSEYGLRLSALREELRGLKRLGVVDSSDFGNYNIKGLDPGKIVIRTNPEKTGLSGEDLFGLLLDKYALQLEKYGEGYVLAMTSVTDTEEGFKRLSAALREIDG